MILVYTMTTTHVNGDNDLALPEMQTPPCPYIHNPVSIIIVIPMTLHVLNSYPDLSVGCRVTRGFIRDCVPRIRDTEG